MKRDIGTEKGPVVEIQHCGYVDMYQNEPMRGSISDTTCWDANLRCVVPLPRWQPWAHGAAPAGGRVLRAVANSSEPGGQYSPRGASHDGHPPPQLHARPRRDAGLGRAGGHGLPRRPVVPAGGVLRSRRLLRPVGLPDHHPARHGVVRPPAASPCGPSGRAGRGACCRRSFSCSSSSSSTPGSWPPRAPTRDCAGTASPRSSTAPTGGSSPTAQSYFAQSGPVTPLLHTWSLAIEEQFYIVWPILVLVHHAAGAARSPAGLQTLLAVSVVGALASALEMALLFDPSGDPTRVYFGTDTHAQCLLVGSGARRRHRPVAPARPTGPADVSSAGARTVLLGGSRVARSVGVAPGRGRSCTTGRPSCSGGLPARLGERGGGDRQCRAPPRRGRGPRAVRGRRCASSGGSPTGCTCGTSPSTSPSPGHAPG